MTMAVGVEEMMRADSPLVTPQQPSSLISCLNVSMTEVLPSTWAKHTSRGNLCWHKETQLELWQHFRLLARLKFVWTLGINNWSASFQFEMNKKHSIEFLWMFFGDLFCNFSNACWANNKLSPGYNPPNVGGRGSSWLPLKPNTETWETWLMLNLEGFSQFLFHQLPQRLFSLMVDSPQHDMARKRFNFCQICRWQKNKPMKHFCFQDVFQFLTFNVQTLRKYSRGSTSKMHLVIFSTYLGIFISDEPTWTLARTTSMGLVTVEAVAAARGPAMACRTRWGQLLGASLESCSVQHQRDRY